MTPRVMAPSDLTNMGPNQRVRVGGRVRGGSGDAVDIVDAFAAVAASGLEHAPDGALVLVDGWWDGRVLTDARAFDVYTSDSGAVCEESIRLFDGGVGVALRQRASMLQHLRGWFDARGFVEVDTPQRVPSPGLDLHLDAFAADGAFLITSPEYQMKRLLAGGVPRIYQLVHCFRAGERGASHNTEFLMLEWYRAFAGIDDVIDDTECVMAHLAEKLTGRAAIEREGRVIDLRPPFLRISVLDAFRRFAGLDEATTLRLAESDEEAYFRRMVDQVEPGLARMDRAVVLRDFPAVHASLARRSPEDPRLCERFEVYVAGMELCNGFGELTDAEEQRERLRSDQDARRGAGKPVYPIDHRFVRALEQGMPPSGGNALGLDRLLALCLGVADIAQVMPFPDDWL